MRSAAQLIADGRKARDEHRLDEARALYAAAAAEYRDDDNVLAYAHSIRHVADMYADETKFAEALPLYEEALELYRSNLQTQVLDLANTVRPYALVHERLGNADVARRYWHEARSLYASLRIDAGVTECDAHLRALSAE